MKTKKTTKIVMKKPGRPPIVVVLGHVDHGKTTLLDYIRQTHIALKEAGQITQHIGAYQVDVGDQKITFIDTPGHEAFNKMRSRGANIADLAILVVAADDGVMPQTQEAIHHIREAKIPMIVAINKVDLPGINLEKIKKQLAKESVLLEGYGGQIVSLPISAKTGEGIKDLLDMIILVSEMEGLEGGESGLFEAVVIESKMDRNRGPLASILVKNGTLCQSDEIFIEGQKSRVRAIINDRGEQIKEAKPGMPVEIFGLEVIPQVGSFVTKTATTISPKVIENESVAEQTQEKTEKIKIILKADTIGTLEALTNSLGKEKAQIISSGTGDITDSDILLAKTTKAIILGFNIRIKPSVVKLAETEHVNYKIYQIIYELLDEIDEVIEALSKPTEEESLGKAEIIAEFPTKKTKIAGCRVIEGRLALGDRIKILRAEKEIGQAKIKSLHSQKVKINKASLGQECGLVFDPPLDFTIGDVVISQR
ncbi:MAG: translation initiation factor IF-2 [Patescibacteria group bacterium]|nr:translation initiation factor IF-2 [Patescibacteria group bacterium]MCL5095593.1 translation initiation factor IF-2 [Patescibacteria group bacterium]